MNQDNEGITKPLQNQKTQTFQVLVFPLPNTIKIDISFPMTLAHMYQAELLVHLINFVNTKSSFPFFIRIVHESLSIKSLSFSYSLALGQQESPKQTNGTLMHSITDLNSIPRLKYLCSIAERGYNKIIQATQEHQIRQSVLAKETQFSSFFVSEHKQIEQLNQEMSHLKSTLLKFVMTSEPAISIRGKEKLLTSSIQKEVCEPKGKEKEKSTTCLLCTKDGNCQEKDTSGEEQSGRKDQQAGLLSRRTFLPETYRPDTA